MDWKDNIKEHETLLSSVLELKDKEEKTLNELFRALEKQKVVCDAAIPTTWPTLSSEPEIEHTQEWLQTLSWTASELLRMYKDEPRSKVQGGDNWTSYSGDKWFVNAQWKELAKTLHLLRKPPSFCPVEVKGTIVDDPMTEDSGLWDIPRGLTVKRDPEKGTTWCGKTDQLVWNSEPTSGTWFWLRKEIEGNFLFKQKFMTLVGGEKGGLLIFALCAKPLDENTSWEHASGPEMSYYYDYFDSYHFSVARSSSGYCNLRRCGPGLIMLASGKDPARELNRWYETAIVKSDGIRDLYVDGKLSCSYLDCGHITPKLNSGRIGFRHVQIYVGQHKDVRVEQLA